MYRLTFRSASLALAAIVALHAAGCVSATTQARRTNLLEVSRLGLAQVEARGGKLIIVAGSHVPEEVVAVLSRLRTVVTHVPASDKFVIPPGYFVLQQVSIRGTHASFVGTAGPHLKNHGLDCGYTYDLNLVQGSDGVWQVAQPITISMC